MTFVWKNITCVHQGRQTTKSALFCHEKCPFLSWKVPFFVQANVAVNQYQRCPFCLEIAMFSKTIWSKTFNFGIVWQEMTRYPFQIPKEPPSPNVFMPPTPLVCIASDQLAEIAAAKLYCLELKMLVLVPHLYSCINLN